MDPNKKLKTVLAAFGAVIVILLIVIAFLLGRGTRDQNGSGSGIQETAAALPAVSGEIPAASAAPQEQGASPAAAGSTAASSVPTATASPSSAATEPADMPRRLEVSISAGTFTVVEGGAFHVEYDESVIKVEQEGDQIEIENRVDHPTASERRRMDVTLTVPRGGAFTDVDMECGAGKLILHALQTETLELELGAGSATLENVIVTGSAEIREGAGELQIKSGSLRDLTLQCGAGATRVHAALPGSSAVHAAVGAVDLDLLDAEGGYAVSFQMGLGACYYNSEKIARSGVFGEGSNSVNVIGGLGVMRVNAKG